MSLIDRTNYNALVDDDGSNTVGTLIVKNTIKTVLLDPIDTAIAPLVQADAATGSSNDFALTAGVTTLRCTNATLRTYTGFAAGVAGQRVRVVATVGQIDFPNQSASSSANNRFINNVTGTISIIAGGSVTYEYDITTLRWRVVTHVQGGKIAVAYVAGNFTAATGSWTVDAGDVTDFGYILDAGSKQIKIFLNLNTTSVSATPITLSVLIPGGLSAAIQQDVVGYFNGEGGTFALGLFVRCSGTTMAFYKLALANWATSTNTTVVTGQFSFEVA